MKKFVICVIAVLSVVFCGCAAQQEEATQQEEEKLREYSRDDGVYDITVFVDPETGVNYLIFRGYCKGSMTVRYNADGTIMVTNFTESEDTE